eukprot:COSAG01_NODE_1915_length_8918_cov_21.920853_1_plen_70_part_00
MGELRWDGHLARSGRFRCASRTPICQIAAAVHGVLCEHDTRQRSSESRPFGLAYCKEEPLPPLPPSPPA